MQVVLLTEEPLIITKGDTGAVLIPLEKYIGKNTTETAAAPLSARMKTSPGDGFSTFRTKTGSL